MYQITFIKIFIVFSIIQVQAEHARMNTKHSELTDDAHDL